MNSPWFGLKPLSLSRTVRLQINLNDFLTDHTNTTSTFLKRALNELQISKQATKTFIDSNADVVAYEVMTHVIRIAYSLINKDEARLEQLTKALNSYAASYYELGAMIQQEVPELAIYNITIEWDALWTNIGVTSFEKSILNLVLHDVHITSKQPTRKQEESQDSLIRNVSLMSHLISRIKKEFPLMKNANDLHSRVDKVIKHYVQDNQSDNSTMGKAIATPGLVLLSYLYEMIITDSIYLKGYTFPEANIVITATGKTSLLFNSDYDVVETLFHELTHHAYALSASTRSQMYGETDAAKHDEVTAHMAAELGRMWYFPLMNHFLFDGKIKHLEGASVSLKRFKNMGNPKGRRQS